MIGGRGRGRVRGARSCGERASTAGRAAGCGRAGRRHAPMERGKSAVESASPPMLPENTNIVSAPAPPVTVANNTALPDPEVAVLLALEAPPPGAGLKKFPAPPSPPVALADDITLPDPLERSAFRLTHILSSSDSWRILVVEWP